MTDDHPPPSSPREINCPKCGTLMQSIYIDAITADRCEVCGGLWLDLMEKERLLRNPISVRKLDSAPTEPARVFDKVTKINCPRDDSSMIHQVDAQQRHIGFESCSVCGGIFLDAGELRDLEDVTLIDRLKQLLG